MKLISCITLSVAVFLFSTPGFSAIECPPFVKCDNKNCQMGPTPPFSYYMFSFTGRNSGTLRFVGAFTRPGLPHLICSYSTIDRKTQADLASNDNLIADFKGAPYTSWQIDSYEEGHNMCFGELSRKIPAECPLIRKDNSNAL